MKLNAEKQDRDNRQMEIWYEGFSNEGHVYAALGVNPTTLDFEATCLLEIPVNFKQEQAKLQ